MTNDKVLNSLYASADAKCKACNVRLINSVDKDTIIGVRTPVLRSMARNMIANGTANAFVAQLPHKFFEENQLHAFIISETPDFDFVMREINRFLPYVDNWATCDQMSPKVFVTNAEKLLPHIKKWLKSKHVYTVRFGIVCLMRYFLQDRFDTKYLDMVAGIKSKEYYINMAQAWYFSVAAVKQFESAYPYFINLEDWTRWCAVQKATKSTRISAVQKKRLKMLAQDTNWG